MAASADKLPHTPINTTRDNNGTRVFQGNTKLFNTSQKWTRAGKSLVSDLTGALSTLNTRSPETLETATDLKTAVLPLKADALSPAFLLSTLGPKDGVFPSKKAAFETGLANGDSFLYFSESEKTVKLGFCIGKRVLSGALHWETADRLKVGAGAIHGEGRTLVRADNGCFHIPNEAFFMPDGTFTACSLLPSQLVKDAGEASDIVTRNKQAIVPYLYVDESSGFRELFVIYHDPITQQPSAPYLLQHDEKWRTFKTNSNVVVAQASKKGEFDIQYNTFRKALKLDIYSPEFDNSLHETRKDAEACILEATPIACYKSSRPGCIGVAFIDHSGTTSFALLEPESGSNTYQHYGRPVGDIPEIGTSFQLDKSAFRQLHPATESSPQYYTPIQQQRLDVFKSMEKTSSVTDRV